MKQLFTSFILLVGMTVMAEEYPLVLQNHYSKDTLAVFSRIDNNPLHTTAVAELPDEINRVEITQTIMVDVIAWFGPDWEGYSSTLSDSDGYCWWTFPNFDEAGRVVTGIASGSGTRNHIGIIIPKGKYRFTFDKRGQNNDFIVEQVSATGLNETVKPNACMKIYRDGQLFILRNGNTYNILGSKN